LVTVLTVVSFLIVLSALLVSVLTVVSFVTVSVLVAEVSVPLLPDLLWQAATENESASATKPILNEFFMV